MNRRSFLSLLSATAGAVCFWRKASPPEPPALTTEYIDASAMFSPSAEYARGLGKISGELSGYWDNELDELKDKPFQIAVDGSPLRIVWDWGAKSSDQDR